MNHLLPILLLAYSGWASAAPDQSTSYGERLFLNNCAECHQRHGRGLPGIYPALAGNELVEGSGEDVALVLIIGRGEMPSFKGAMSGAEMSAIINYVRNAWGNQGEKISAARVDALLGSSGN